MRPVRSLLVLRSSYGFVGVRVGGDVADGLGLQQYSDAQYPPPSHYLSILDYNTVWSLMLFAPGDEDELQSTMVYNQPKQDWLGSETYYVSLRGIVSPQREMLLGRSFTELHRDQSAVEFWRVWKICMPWRNKLRSVTVGVRLTANYVQ